LIKTLRTMLKQDKGKFVVPKTVQQSVPVNAVYEDGIFTHTPQSLRTLRGSRGGKKYSKTFRFDDINYAVATKEDKEAMFLEYSELLNSLDSGATTKITINNRRINKSDFEKRILIPMQDDGLDIYRREYNQMLLDKIAGGNGIIQEKYVTMPPKCFLLSEDKNRPIEPRTMQNHFSKYVAACGIENAKFHCTRHSFATRCVESGFDIKTLSLILGHSSVKITLERYVHPSMDLKRENMAKLSQLVS